MGGDHEDYFARRPDWNAHALACGYEYCALGHCGDGPLCALLDGGHPLSLLQGLLALGARYPCRDGPLKARRVCQSAMRELNHAIRAAVHICDR